MYIEPLLARLKKVRKTGHNQWKACCPAHDDRTPSLSLTEGPDGRILIHCFAECGGADIMAAVGLSLSDLYPDGPLREWYKGVHSQPKKPSTDKDKILLRMFDSDRQAGVRLTPDELRQEREAFERVRNSK